MVRAVTQSAASTSNELIKTLAEEIKARGGKPICRNCLPNGKAFVPR